MKRFFITLIGLFLSFSAFAQLPSISLKNIEGKTVQTDKLCADGNPLIISFFATNCKPCLRELKAIHEVYADWQDETGVTLVAVSIDEGQNSQKVKPLADGNGWEYEVLLDSNGDFKRAMNVSLIPAVFIVDGNGKIVYNHTGYTEGGEAELIKKVRELVK